MQNDRPDDLLFLNFLGKMAQIAVFRKFNKSTKLIRKRQLYLLSHFESWWHSRFRNCCFFNRCFIILNYVASYHVVIFQQKINKPHRE